MAGVAAVVRRRHKQQRGGGGATLLEEAICRRPAVQRARRGMFEVCVRKDPTSSWRFMETEPWSTTQQPIGVPKQFGG